MRTIAGRVGVALLVFGLITLATVGGALWVALRDLHRDASLAALAELTVPYASQARQRFALDLLRPFAVGDRPSPETLRIYRESRQGRAASEAFATFVREAQEEIDESGVSVLLVQDDRTIVRDPSSGLIQTLATNPRLSAPPSRGTVRTGLTEVEGLGEVLYAATPIREPLVDRAVPTLVLARQDDSARLATADLVRALSVAGLVLLLVGVPLALGLSRSVAAPLRRLASASVVVGRGAMPDSLPTSGPLEVTEATIAFNAMVAEVEATRRAQQRLLADIRHDLRTPLTVIAGFSQALSDGTARGPAAERAALAIADEAGRLERMLADLDHLSVAGGRGPRLRLEPLDGLSLADATVERFMAEATGRGQVVTLMAPARHGADTTLLGDRDALDRILGNIMANALAHAPSPGGHVGVEVRPVGVDEPPIGGPGGWAGRRGVMIAIRDDGPGIPAAALPHVFDRFYRADSSRASRGSGLGLAIVRDLVEALGGRVFAEDPSGGGARVGVVLPAVRDSRAASPPA